MLWESRNPSSVHQGGKGCHCVSPRHDFLRDKTTPRLCYRGLCLRVRQLWLLLMWTNCVDLIPQKCIPRNARLLGPQCLQRGFLHAAAAEVALPSSSPYLPSRGLVGSPQHCPAIPLQLGYHLSAIPVPKRDGRCVLSETCSNFTSRHTLVAFSYCCCSCKLVIP